MIRMAILIAVFAGGVEGEELSISTEIIGRYVSYETCQQNMAELVRRAPPNYWFSCKELNADMI